MPGLGRVLVAHGHAYDPVHSSWLGRLGAAVSRRFGRWTVVYLAMQLADTIARLAGGRKIVEVFRERWLALLKKEGLSLGVFGHVHVSEIILGQRYANCGFLSRDLLEYLALEPNGPRLCRLHLSELG